MSQSHQAAAPGLFIINLQYVDAFQASADRHETPKYGGVRRVVSVALFVREIQ